MPSRPISPTISAQIRQVEEARQAAEPSHLRALETFAARAYRRPLSPAEHDDLLAFYRRARADQDGLSHEDAIRDSVASMLLSPHFCYRFDRAAPGKARQSAVGVRPGQPAELLPLVEHARRRAAGPCRRGRLAQAGRSSSRRRGGMLRDDRVRGLATEFAGNWLAFRRFEEHNSVDRERFASFTNELRQAMYEEPIRFFVDLAQRDGSVLDLLDADHTFVNPILAKHYGMPVPRRQARRVGPGRRCAAVWPRRPPADVGLPDRNSPGLRTSPVKRGYWVVRRMLGEHIPAAAAGGPRAAQG